MKVERGMEVEHNTFPPVIGRVSTIEDILNSNDRRIGVINRDTGLIYYDLESTWNVLSNEEIVDSNTINNETIIDVESIIE